MPIQSPHFEIETKNGRVQISISDAGERSDVGILVERGELSAGCLITRDQALAISDTLRSYAEALPLQSDQAA